MSLQPALKPQPRVISVKPMGSIDVREEEKDEPPKETTLRLDEPSQNEPENNNPEQKIREDYKPEVQSRKRLKEITSNENLMSEEILKKKETEAGLKIMELVEEHLQSTANTTEALEDTIKEVQDISRTENTSKMFVSKVIGQLRSKHKPRAPEAKKFRKEEDKEQSNVATTPAQPPPKIDIPPLDFSRIHGIGIIKRDLMVGSKFVYIEKPKRFRRVTAIAFYNKMKAKKKNMKTQNSEKIRVNGVPTVYFDLATAINFQRAFHSLSLIMQGFLSGLTVAEAVFAFNFANEELLVQGYRWMSLPIHVAFCICFTIGCVSSFDRTRFYGWGPGEILQTLKHGGCIGILLWMGGLATTVACIPFDEALAPTVINPKVTPELLYNWRVLSAVRAACASFAWLLFALRSQKNELGESLKRLLPPSFFTFTEGDGVRIAENKVWNESKDNKEDKGNEKEIEQKDAK